MKLDQLRVPFLVLAILLSLMLVLAEAGLTQYQEHLDTVFELFPPIQTDEIDPVAQIEKLAIFSADQLHELNKLLEDAQTTQQEVSQPLRTFGFGLRYLWLVDGLLLFSLLLIGLGVIVPPAIQARFQGVLTLLYALFVIITAIVLILEALAAAILMISMLLAFPFGTIVYLAKWSNFNRAGAAAILSVFFTIKLFIAGSVVLAHQRFLQNLGLIVIIIGSLVANIIVSLLHGLVPGFLVSISDAVAGIVVGIVGAILAVVLLVAAILSTITALR